MKSIQILLSLVLIHLLSGCAASEYKVMVNGYLDEDKSKTFESGATYCIVQQEEIKNPLLYKEVKIRIAKLLEKKGFDIASLQEADFCVGLLLGEAGAKQVITDYIADPFWSGPYWGSYGPSWAMHSGFHTANRVTVKYSHFLVLQVYEAALFREKKKKEMIWVGEASMLSSTPDIRSMVGYMLKAVISCFGQDTRKGKFISVKKEKG